MFKQIAGILLTGLILSVNVQSSFAQFTISADTNPDTCGTVCVLLRVDSPIGGNTYNWFLETATCSTSSGSGNAGIGVTNSVCQTGVYFCVSTDTNGTTETSNSVNVRILDGQLPAPYPTANVFCMDTVEMCILSHYYEGLPTTISWFKDAVLIPGADSGSYIATSPGVYRYAITNGCITRPSTNVAVNPIHPKPEFSSSLTSPVCSNETITFTVTNSLPGYIYIWERLAIGGGGYIQLGVGETFDYTVPPNGDVTVRVRAVGGGCTVPPSDDVLFTIQMNLPTISPSGMVDFCGGTSQLLTASPGPVNPAGYNFQWYRAGSPIPGATSQTYNATKGGKYEVVITANCGSRISDFTELNKITPPSVTISPASSTIICKTDSVDLTSTVSGNAPFTYQWKKYGNNLIGATGTEYRAKTSGNFKLVVTDVTGCSRSSNKISVSVLPLPSASISAGGPTTLCEGDDVTLTANQGAGFTYQWKNYSNLLPGATNINYVADFSGKFKCIVSNAAGCGRASNAIFVWVFPCPDGSSAKISGSNETEFNLNAYPNPSMDGQFMIEVEGGYEGALMSLIVYDMTGRVVEPEVDFATSGSVRISGLNKGVYVADVKMNGISKKIKLISK